MYMCVCVCACVCVCCNIPHSRDFQYPEGFKQSLEIAISEILKQLCGSTSQICHEE